MTFRRRWHCDLMCARRRLIDFEARPCASTDTFPRAPPSRLLSGHSAALRQVARRELCCPTARPTCAFTVCPTVPTPVRPEPPPACEFTIPAETSSAPTPTLDGPHYFRRAPVGSLQEVAQLTKHSTFMQASYRALDKLMRDRVDDYEAACRNVGGILLPVPETSSPIRGPTVDTREYKCWPPKML